MGDRFYESQKGSKRAADKPKRILKADVVKAIEAFAGVHMPGLIKTDLKTLHLLHESFIKMNGDLEC